MKRHGFLKKILGCFLLVALGNVQAIPFFDITTTNKVVPLVAGTTANITYTITNRINADISNMQYVNPALTSKSSLSTCTGTLVKGGSCTEVLTVRAPSTASESGNILLDPLRVCGIERGLVCSVANQDNQIQIKVVKTLVQGRFVFRNSNGVDITSLDLAQGSTNTVTLNNTGVGAITNINAMIPSSLTPYFTGSCTSTTELAPGVSCQLNYDITPGPASPITDSISFSGSNVANTPIDLEVRVAAQEGRFVFFDSTNQEINSLNLSPNDKNTITLRNTGGGTITGISAMIPPSLTPYFTGSCTSTTELAPGASCQLNYDITPGPVDLITAIISFSGSNVANTPIDLGVRVAAQEGRFVFFDSTNQEITNLNLSPNDKNTITLRNTGGGTITGISAMIPPSLTPYFTGSCTSTTELAPGVSCQLNYDITPGPVSPITDSISFSGSNVANTPIDLEVRVAAQEGRFVFFDSTNQEISSLNLSPNDKNTITLRNTGGGTITGISAMIPPSLTPYFTGSCTSTTELAPGVSCQLNYDITPGPASPITDSISFSGSNVANTPIDLEVRVAAQEGRFVFFDSTNQEINSLNLSPNDKNTITLRNTGGGTITGISATIPSSLTPYFTGSCTSTTELAPGVSCQLNYDITPGPANPITDSINFSGSNVVNTPIRLGVKVATQGRFVFFDSTNQEISSLNLSPNDKNTITLRNVGGSAITGISVMIPPSLTPYFTGSCTSTTELAPGASCQLNYDITPSPANPITDSINFSGSNVVNTPIRLEVTVATQGRFVFFDSNNQEITNLNLSPNDKNTITLRNTGGSTITNINEVLPPPLNNYFTSSCMVQGILPPNQICRLEYTIPAAPSSVSDNITVTGDNAENSPINLAVTVATQGRFVFFDSNNQEINSLNLSPNDKNTITLRNTGGSAITGISATIPPSLTPYFTGNCTSTTELASGASCQLMYTIPAAPPTPISGNITVTGDSAGNSPISLEVEIARRRLFVTNVSNSKVIVCDVDGTTGALNGCTDTNADNLGQPFSIVLNNAGTRAYIADARDNVIILCNVSPSGIFSGCGDAGGSLIDQPLSIALRANESQLFIVNEIGNTVVNCAVNAANGMLDSCTLIPNVSFNDPTSLILDTTNNYAYITEYAAGQVQNCEVELNGNLSNCTSSNATTLNQPYGIVFNSDETRAYIANNGNNTVTLCDVSNTRQFSSCVVTLDKDLNFPRGIVLNSTHAYIANRGNTNIVVCNISSSGSLTKCNSTNGGGLFDQPMGLYYREG